MTFNTVVNDTYYTRQRDVALPFWAFVVPPAHIRMYCNVLYTIPTYYILDTIYCTIYYKHILNTVFVTYLALQTLR